MSQVSIFVNYYLISLDLNIKWLEDQMLIFGLKTQFSLKKYDHLGHTCSLKFVFYFILFLKIENKEQRPNNF